MFIIVFSPVLSYNKEYDIIIFWTSQNAKTETEKCIVLTTIL